MALFKNSGPQELSGRNIYHDKKNRTIYLSPITKKAYVLRHEHFQQYSLYSSRIIFAIMVFILMSGVVFEKPLFNMPYPIPISIACSLAVYGFLSYRFYYKFLPSLTVLPRYVPEKKVSYLDSSRSDTLARNIIKVVALILLAILFVLNGQDMYAKNEAITNLYLSYALAIGSGILALVQLYALLTRNKITAVSTDTK